MRGFKTSFFVLVPWILLKGVINLQNRVFTPLSLPLVRRNANKTNMSTSGYLVDLFISKKIRILYSAEHKRLTYAIEHGQKGFSSKSALGSVDRYSLQIVFMIDWWNNTGMNLLISLLSYTHQSSVITCVHFAFISRKCNYSMSGCIAERCSRGLINSRWITFERQCAAQRNCRCDLFESFTNKLLTATQPKTAAIAAIWVNPILIKIQSNSIHKIHVNLS